MLLFLYSCEVDWDFMKDTIRIIYAEEKYLSSFHQALDRVAREQIYVEMITAPAWEKTFDFFKKQTEGNFPVYYAIHDEKVVGWADISPSENPRLAHRGFLGMGLIDGYRGQGLGSQLLEACIQHAKKIEIEKIELSVYSNNSAAIALYKKFGFQEMGFIKHYRKLNEQYFDCVQMEKFL